LETLDINVVSCRPDTGLYRISVTFSWLASFSLLEPTFCTSLQTTLFLHVRCLFVNFFVVFPKICNTIFHSFLYITMKYSTVSIIAVLSHHVAGHGIVTKIVAGTKTYQGYDPNFQYMATPPPTIGWAAPATQDRGPVQGDAYQNPDIICQRGATNAKASAEVAAGDTVSLQWTSWPTSHKGPMLDYLADCGGDCSTVDKTTLKFFKIDGVGMTGLTGVSSDLAFFSFQLLKADLTVDTFHVC
jgi:hypothetical protein